MMYMRMTCDNCGDDLTNKHGEIILRGGLNSVNKDFCNMRCLSAWVRSDKYDDGTVPENQEPLPVEMGKL